MYVVVFIVHVSPYSLSLINLLKLGHIDLYAYSFEKKIVLFVTRYKAKRFKTYINVVIKE